MIQIYLIEKSFLTFCEQFTMKIFKHEKVILRGNGDLLTAKILRFKVERDVSSSPLCACADSFMIFTTCL